MPEGNGSETLTELHNVMVGDIVVVKAPCHGLDRIFHGMAMQVTEITDGFEFPFRAEMYASSLGYCNRFVASLAVSELEVIDHAD